MTERKFDTMTDCLNWKELQRLRESKHGTATTTTTQPPATPDPEGEVTTVRPDQVHSVRRDRQGE